MDASPIHNPNNIPNKNPNKMTKREKKMMWIGISLLLAIPLTILVFHDIPQLIADVNNIELGWLGGPKGDNPSLGYFIVIGAIIIPLISVPLLIAGSILVARSILRWQKAKYLNTMTVLFTILLIVLIIMLGVGIFVIAGIIWRGHL